MESRETVWIEAKLALGAVHPLEDFRAGAEGLVRPLIEALEQTFVRLLQGMP